MKQRLAVRLRVGQVFKTWYFSFSEPCRWLFLTLGTWIICSIRCLEIPCLNMAHSWSLEYIWKGSIKYRDSKTKWSQIIKRQHYKMASPNVQKYNPPFEPGRFFHVYNHAVGSELLFKENENYRFFLKKFSKYLNHHISLYSYCLLPNHFHLLIKVLDQTSCENVSEQFRKFLISYSKSFNKQYSRRGNLFEKHLKRIPVTTDEHLIWLIFYLHRNPVHHHYSKYFKSYPWSSYRSILSNKNTDLAREKTIELFSGESNFISFHERNMFDFNAIQDLLLEWIIRGYRHGISLVWTKRMTLLALGT